MQITFRQAMEVASSEAIARSAYLDRVARPPIWTWSIGITHKTGHDVERYKDRPQTLEHCLTVYVWALDTFAEAVRREFADEPLTESQFGALLSFAYNVGPGALSSATWIKDFRRGDTAKARRNIMNWVHAGDVRVPGLVARRQKERDLFFDGKWSAGTTILEYEVNANYQPVNPRRVDISEPLRAALARHYGTPVPKPTPKPTPKPASPVKEVATGVGGTVVTVSGIETGNWWLVGIGLAIIAAGGAIFIIRRRG